MRRSTRVKESEKEGTESLRFFFGSIRRATKRELSKLVSELIDVFWGNGTSIRVCLAFAEIAGCQNDRGFKGYFASPRVVVLVRGYNRVLTNILVERG